jgi:hypothetical protein
MSYQFFWLCSTKFTNVMCVPAAVVDGAVAEGDVVDGVDGGGDGVIVSDSAVTSSGTSSVGGAMTVQETFWQIFKATTG